MMMMSLTRLCFVIYYSPMINSLPHWSNLKFSDILTPSIKEWQTLNNSLVNSGKFTVLSMHVYNSHDGTWYIPSRHEKYSVGWNRSISYSSSRPATCNIQFYGIALQNGFEDYVSGGTGYIKFAYNPFKTSTKKGKNIWSGYFGSNSSLNYNCYYMSNKDFGSEFKVFIFIDTYN